MLPLFFQDYNFREEEDFLSKFMILVWRNES